jgi:hypothetical protein
VLRLFAARGRQRRLAEAQTKNNPDQASLSRASEIGADKPTLSKQTQNDSIKITP